MTLERAQCLFSEARGREPWSLLVKFPNNRKAKLFSQKENMVGKSDVCEKAEACSLIRTSRLADTSHLRKGLGLGLTGSGSISGIATLGCVTTTPCCEPPRGHDPILILCEIGGRV